MPGRTLRRRRYFLALALVAALALGFGASTAPAEAQQERYLIQGTVVGPNDEPVAGVLAAAVGTGTTFGPWTGTTTDSAGRFSVRVPDGAYWILLYRGECFLGLFDLRGQRVGAIPTPSHQRVVTAGADVSGVDLRLRASLTELCRAIRGTATDAEGSPLPNHSLGAFGYGGPEGVQTGAATKADGTFTLYVPDGTHRLTIATTAGDTCTIRDHDSAHEGGGVEVAGADLAGIQLVVSGQPNPVITRLRCSFPDRRGPQLQGTVRDGAGNPAPGVTVEAWGVTGPTFGPWTDPATDAEGRFAIQVPDGRYNLQAYVESGGATCFLGVFGAGGVRAQPYEQLRHGSRIAVEGAGVAAIDIKLRATPDELCRSVRGVVVDADGEPIDRVSVILQGPGESAVERQGAPTMDDGTFHAQAADGTYRVIVVADAGSECTITSPATSDTGGPASIVVSGGDVTGVRIVLSGDRRSTSGWSRCYSPAPMAETVLHPGWNLVGWTGDETDPKTLFDTLRQLQIVLAWDVEYQWFQEAYRGDAGRPLGNLSVLRPGMGLWLYVQGTKEVIWTRPVVPRSGLVSLAEGWNLVAWAGQDGIAVEDAFTSLGSALSVGATWDATSQQFRHYSASARGSAAGPQAVQRGAGIWIKAAHARNWLQPGSTLVTVEATGDVSETARSAAADTARAVVYHFAERYGLFAPGTVFLVTGHIQSLGGWYYRGTVHLDDTNLRALPHEYSHALQDSLVRTVDKSPAWITEGVANRWSALYSDATGETSYDVHIRDTVIPSARRSPIPLERMEASLFLNDYAGPNYSVAHLAIDWLVTFAGEDRTFDYYSRRSEYNTWQDAFEAIFGISVDDFYESFAAHRQEVTSSR